MEVASQQLWKTFTNYTILVTGKNAGIMAGVQVREAICLAIILGTLMCTRINVYSDRLELGDCRWNEDHIPSPPPHELLLWLVGSLIAVILVISLVGTTLQAVNYWQARRKGKINPTSSYRSGSPESR